MTNWKVDENKELPVAVIEDTEEGFGICTLDGEGTACREELENIARLIAIAPELLEFATNFFEWHANHFEDFDSEVNGQLLCLANNAEKAIAKVKRP